MRTERQSAGCLCPKHARAIGRMAELEEENVRLKTRVAHLESRLRTEVRDARETPFGENTPPSKADFRKDPDEAARLRQGGAKPGHEGHGRRRVAPEDADERREAPAPSVCPDCGATLVRVAPEDREVRDIPPPRLRTVHWTVGRGFCPYCRKAFAGTVPGVPPRFAATNRAIARNAADRHLHRMTVGTVSRRTGMNASTVVKEDGAPADILGPCAHRPRGEYLEADTKHADETGWPCSGAHGRYAYGFFAEDVSPYRFRKTRKGEVAAAVFGGRKPHGVLVTGRYTGYDRPWRGDRQYCYAHVLRKLLRLPREGAGQQGVQGVRAADGRTAPRRNEAPVKGASARGLRPRGRGDQVQDRGAGREERERPGAAERAEHLQGACRQDVPLGEGP